MHVSNRSPKARSDDGASLIIVILVLLVASATAIAMLSYASSVMRARPTFDARSRGTEAVRSAVQVAITKQREAGPADCYAYAETLSFNDVPVTIACETTRVDSNNRMRYGVITTGIDPTMSHFSSAGGAPKEILGNVFINGGHIDSAASDLVMKSGELRLSSAVSGQMVAARYQTGVSAPAACSDPSIPASDSFPTGVAAVSSGTAAHTVVCGTEPWWTFAGERTSTGTWQPSYLPPVPAYTRNGNNGTVGACKVYFPGRYNNALVLNGGVHYFTSGIYYLRERLTVSNGAIVVIGEGRFGGCANDAAAALNAASPRNHAISGKGATIILGAAGSISVTNAVMRINRRVSTVTNRASEGVAIRTVSHGIDTAAVRVPADSVLLADGQIVTAASTTYSASTLTPAADVLHASLDTGEFSADGAVIVPNSRLRIESSTASYTVRVPASVIASDVVLNLATAPSSGPNGFQFGYRDVAVGRQVRITASAVVRDRLFTSTALFEVQLDRRYAINSWTMER